MVRSAFVEYGLLISRSFAIVWRQRYLWLLALLGGADVGSGSGFTFQAGLPSIEYGASAAQALPILQNEFGPIILLGVPLLVVLALFLLSCLTTGALIRASAEHDAERPFRPVLAWRTGLGTFWAILGLRMIVAAVAMVAVAVVGLLALAGYLAYSDGRGVALTAVIITGVLFVVLLFPAAGLFGIAVTLATRAVVLEQRGTIASLWRGLHLLRMRLGRTLLVWLIQVGLGIGVSTLVSLPMFVLVVVFGGLVATIGLTVGPPAAIAVGTPIGLALIAALALVSSMSGAYFSTYWTLAFRRLELYPAQPPATWLPGTQPPASTY